MNTLHYHCPKPAMSHEDITLQSALLDSRGASKPGWLGARTTNRHNMRVCLQTEGYMKNDIRIWLRMEPVVRDGRWVKEPCNTEVCVMSVAEGYAMVRRPGAVPFVVSLKELSPKPAA